MCKQVTVALKLDQENLDKDLSELDLFYQTKETYFTLQQIADEHDIRKRAYSI